MGSARVVSWLVELRIRGALSVAEMVFWSLTVRDDDAIGPTFDRVDATLAVWVDVGGHSRVRLSGGFLADDAEPHGIRWQVADALRVLGVTPAQVVT